MKCLLKQIFNCYFQNSKRILVLILNKLIFLFLFIFLGFLLWWSLVSSFVEGAFIFFDFKYFFGGLEDAFLDLLDFVEGAPILHAVFPAEGIGHDFVGPEQNIQIS